MIFDQYWVSILTRYPHTTVVFDKYDGGPTTKYQTQGRGVKFNVKEVLITADIHLQMPRDEFLSHTQKIM